MTFDVNSWWTFLCIVAALNVVAWLYSAYLLRRSVASDCDDTYSVCRIQLILSAVYVLGCGFRSVIPLYDIPRLCLVDSLLCNVAVGRSVATIAELSFVAQWALMLRQLSKTTHSATAYSVSRVIFPMIVVAEIFSWYSVLTTSNIGHVVEETLWGASATLLVISLVAMRSRCGKQLRWLLDGCCTIGTCYVAYMFLVDVPMYWSRWIHDEQSGRAYMTLVQGLTDSIGRGTVSHRWEDWRSEVVWMSVYFSVAVWLSISLVHFARLSRPVGKDSTPQRG